MAAHDVVDLARRQSVAHADVPALARAQVVGVDAVAQGGDEELVGSGVDEARGRCVDGLADAFMARDAAFVVDVDAELAAYPDAPVVVLCKRVDVGALGLQVEHREALGATVEAVDALVVDADPDALVGVGHEAAWQRVFAA